MLQLNVKPLADFDRPIDMMQDCHRRVERFLSALIRAGDEAPDPLEDEWKQLLKTALDYFAGAAPLHTQDEEESLFPRIREHTDQIGVTEALEAIQQLELDHDAAEPLHEAQETIGRKWLNDERLTHADRMLFVELSTALHGIYEEHIRIEDEHIYVVARRVIDAPTQQQIGAEMRARRGGSSCSERKAAQRPQKAK